MSLRDHTAGWKFKCLTPGWIKQSTTGVIGMVVMYCIQSLKLWYFASHHLLLQSIASGLIKKQFFRRLIECTLIDITQLGWPTLTDISLLNFSCTFAYLKSEHVCALRTVYPLAQWLNYYILSLQYAKWPSQPVFHKCIEDDYVGVTSTYVPPQWAAKKVSPSIVTITSNRKLR